MKTATVTAYIDTGFSGINVPDSPAILENGALKKQLNVINCLPLSGQVNVSIRVKDYPELHATDYIKMEFSGDNTTYWAKVNGYAYLSSDTVEISLTMDYWLTLGGINNVSSISGITQRVHVAKSDDSLFAYNEPDEMINPAKALKTVSDEFNMGDINSSYDPDDTPDDPLGENVSVTVVMSTLDLYAIGRLYQVDDDGTKYNTDDNGDKFETAKVLESEYQYLDPDTQQMVTENKTVTIPKLYTIGEIKYTDFKTTWGLTNDDASLADSKPYGQIQVWVPKPTDNDWTAGEVVDLALPKVGYFDASDPWVQKGIAIVHDCGVEDCLLDQYRVPAEYILQNYGRYCGRAILYGAHANDGILTTSSALDYEYGTYQARNKKVYTGGCNAYSIYAKASSEMQTFNPEVIFANSGDTSPLVRMSVDLRHEGGAMLSPLMINGDVKRWYMNFVKEMQFQSAPLKFDGMSGKTISEGLMYMGLNTKNANFNQQYPIDGLTQKEAIMNEFGEGIGLGSMVGGGGSLLGGGIGTAGGLIVGGYLDSALYSKDPTDRWDPFGVYEKFGGRGIQMNNQTSSLRKQTYNAMVNEEKIGMDLRNTYVAPQIRFQQSQTIRELIGNGFIIFKYQMSDEDLERCDKLLTMYGYRHSKSLEMTDLTNRPAFNYIEAGEVHITTSVAVPKWVREGAEDQLIGVRLWHKMFDVDEYEDNE